MAKKCIDLSENGRFSIKIGEIEMALFFIGLLAGLNSLTYERLKE
jgi:hypothetical protein